MRQARGVLVHQGSDGHKEVAYKPHGDPTEKADVGDYTLHHTCWSKTSGVLEHQGSDGH